MKKILIPLDYNPSAQKVAKEGYALAKMMNAQVILLHVIADDIFYSVMEPSPLLGFNEFSINEFNSIVNEEGINEAAIYYIDKCKRFLGEESIKTIVEKGDFADVILKIAKQQHADLIIMGSHSRRWYEQILVGSVTERVLHKTTVPLLIIPVKEGKTKPQTQKLQTEHSDTK